MMFEPFPRYKPLIDDYPAFREALSRPLPVTLWANPDRIDAATLGQMLAEAGLEPSPLSWYPGGFKLPADRRAGKRWEFFSGLYQIQEEAAMLPVRLLDPKPGELVLDMCAAPGNKTAQIAFAMNNRGTLVANDLNRKRLPALRQTCERLGLRNVSISNLNGANIAANAARFDRVLVDAPCSCEGTTRKNPGQAAESEPHFTEKKRGAQAALLRKAFQLCRTGGRIVYSTCTYAPEENEAVINDLLQTYGEHRVKIANPDVPPSFEVGSGITEWEGETYHPDVIRCLRVWPHQNDTGGFVVAVIEKLDEVGSEDAPEPDTRTADIPTASTAPVNTALERFGIPGYALDGLRPVTGRGDQIFLVANDHCLPAYFSGNDTGLRCLRTDSKVPKPTHPGALFLGQAATANCVELSTGKLLDFMARTAIDIEPEELVACDGTGFVMVKCGEFACGLGILCRADDGHHYLASNYPRRWSARLFS